MLQVIQKNGKLLLFNNDLFPEIPFTKKEEFNPIYQLKYIIYLNGNVLNLDRDIKYRPFYDLYYEKDKLVEMNEFIDKLRRKYYSNVHFYLYSFYIQDIFLSFYFMKEYLSNLNDIFEWHKLYVNPRYVICDVRDDLHNEIAGVYSFAVVDKKKQIVYKSSTIFGCLLYVYYQLDLFVKDFKIPESNGFFDFDADKISKSRLEYILKRNFHYSIVELNKEKMIIDKEDLNPILRKFVVKFTEHFVDRMKLTYPFIEPYEAKYYYF